MAALDLSREASPQGEPGAVDTEEVYVLPTSLGQERYWAIDQINPKTSVLNVAVRFFLEGKLKPELVERAFDDIIARHEVLRTTFTKRDGQVMQVIAPSVKISMPIIDLRLHDDQEREIDRLSLEEAQKGFNLFEGPLLRIKLVRIADAQQFLLLTLHHAVADYWSIGLIVNELAILYDAYEGRSAPLFLRLAVQYGDFAVWQREQVTHELMRDQLSFWQKQLSGIRAVNFPFEMTRLSTAGHHAEIVSSVLPSTLTDTVKDIANGEGATFFNIMFAALAVVVQRITGQNEFGIGSQVAGRRSVELESVVGLFVNTVILRADLSGDPTFIGLIERIRRMTVESLANADVPFEQVLADIYPANYLNHDSLFNINFICQRDEIRTHGFGGIKLTVLPSKSQGALYDLNVFLILRTDGWRLSCEYKTDLFIETDVILLLENYKKVLEQVCENPERRISGFTNLASFASEQHTWSASGLKKSSAACAGEASSSNTRLSASERIAEDIARPGTLGGIEQTEIYSFPTTLNQQRFWVLDQLIPGNPTLNMPVALRLDGPLRTDIIERSLNELQRRHEILRTTFKSIDGTPSQIIHPSTNLELTEIALDGLGESDQESRADALLHEEALHSFDLSKGPLFRATLARLAKADHILMLTMPHIVCDGWSNGILVRELTSIYTSLSQNRPSPLPEPSIQFADFAHWQNECPESAKLDDDLAFWKKRLSGRLPLLDLPADRSTRPGLVSRGAAETLLMSPGFVTQLKAFCKREEITMFMLLLAGFKAVLSRLSGQEDILVGSPITGRMPETEDVIGPFSYPISLRTDLSGDPSFRELLRRIRDVTIEALTHKDLDFSRVLKELGTEQLRGRNPLFQIYFLHQVAFLQPVKTGGLSWSPYTWTSPGTAFDLHLATVERVEGISCRLEYNPDMFEAGTIKRVVQQYQSILVAIAADPEMRISELPFSTTKPLESPSSHSKMKEADKRSTERSVLELFKEQSYRAPTKAAGIFGKDILTYRQLDTKSDVFADRLRRLDLDGDRLVGIWGELSPDVMIAVIGTLKAGCTYIWLSPDDATDSEPISTLLGHMKVAIADKHLVSWLESRGVEFVFTPRSMIMGSASNGSPSFADIRSPACLLLTTASRRALIVTHEALSLRAAATVKAYDLVAEDRVALINSVAREDAILAILTIGATAVFANHQMLDSQSGLAALVEKRACNVLLLTARHFEAMVIARERDQKEFFKTVRLVAVHGDKPAQNAIAMLMKQAGGSVRFVSAFGTAETGSNAVNWEALKDFGTDNSVATQHLGRPAAGFSLTVVDRYSRPAPVGVIGEICIGGNTLAQYFPGDTESVTERFFTIPNDHRRFFRSGDLGRYLSESRIEFLGPLQRHSNVRGFRRHFSDLEFTLMLHSCVKWAIAVPSEDLSGNGRIVAYILLESAGAGRTSSDRYMTVRGELQELVAQSAQSHSSGLTIVFVDNLRLNKNGNVDLQNLPHFDSADVNAFSAPSAALGKLEAKLIEIWEDLLGIRPIQITDNFFDLGGHSLLALRLFSRISDLWRKTLPLSTLFQAPTVALLAEILRRDGWSPPTSSLVAIRSDGARPPLYIISGIGGNVVRFHALGRYLNPDQPLYALQPPGVDGTLPHLRSVEDMAALYIREIKILQPEGPYYLAGYSFGGLVAFHMGCELLNQEEQIGLLALLDSPEWHYVTRAARNTRLRHPLIRCRARLSRLLFATNRIQYLKLRLGRQVSRIIYSSFRRLHRDLPGSFGSLSDINAFAASNYTPRFFPGCLTLLRTKMPSGTVVLHDPALGWSSLASALEIYEVPGNHDDMTAEPHVKGLAQKLNTLLTGSSADGLSGKMINTSNRDRGENNSNAIISTATVQTHALVDSLTGSYLSTVEKRNDIIKLDPT
jgi:non-ribosomal peptide synthetase component F/thioesterase domain-containing protein